MFGHATSKTTCLWLKNLEPLESTEVVEPEWVDVSKGKRMSRFHYDSYVLPRKKDGKLEVQHFLE